MGTCLAKPKIEYSQPVIYILASAPVLPSPYCPAPSTEPEYHPLPSAPYQVNYN